MPMFDWSRTMDGVVPFHSAVTPPWRTTPVSTSMEPLPEPDWTLVLMRSVGLVMPAATAPLTMPAVIFSASELSGELAPSRSLVGWYRLILAPGTRDGRGKGGLGEKTKSEMSEKRRAKDR